MKRVYVRELKVGDVIGMNVAGRGARTIVTRGTTVTKTVIETLRQNGIPSVPIEDGKEEEKTPVVSEEQSAEKKSHREKLKTTKEYKKFVEDYTKAIECAERRFDELAKGDTSETLGLMQDSLVIARGLYTQTDVINYIEMTKTASGYLYEHSIATSIMAYILARWCDYPEMMASYAAVAGMLHDIGMVEFADIINKKEPLTDAEQLKLKSHAMKGYEILKNVNGIDDSIKMAVLQHHEKLDGSGYPLGTSGDDITKLAQIIGIVGTFDSMTRESPYSKAMTPQAAFTELSNTWFEQYDAKIMLTFLDKVMDSFLHNSIILTDGREGVIQFVNKQNGGKLLVETKDGAFVEVPAANNLQVAKII